MALIWLDILLLLPILALATLGGKIALHLLSPHLRASPFTRTSWYALLALIASGEATLLLYMVSVFTGNALRVPEFLLERIMGIVCLFLSANACVAFCEPQKPKTRGEFRLSKERVEEQERGEGHENVKSSVFTSFLRGYLLAVAVSVSFISVLYPDVQPCWPPGSVPSVLVGDAAQKMVEYSDYWPPSGKGLPTRATMNTDGLAQRNPSKGREPTVGLAVDTTSPTTDTDQRVSNKSSGVKSSSGLIYLSRTENRNSAPILPRKLPIAVNKEETGGTITIHKSVPISNEQIRKAMAMSSVAGPLCIHNWHTTGFIYGFFYLPLLIYLALGILASQKNSSKDVEHNVLDKLDDETTILPVSDYKEDITTCEKPSIMTNLKMFFQLKPFGVLESAGDSVPTAQGMTDDGCFFQHSVTHLKEVKIQPHFVSQATTPAIETENKSSEESKDLTSLTPKPSHLTGFRGPLEQSQQQNEMLRPKLHSFGETEVAFSRQQKQEMDRGKHSKVFQPKSSETVGLAFEKSRPTKAVVASQEQLDSVAASKDCRACQQLAPYVIMAAIVFLVQHVLIMPLWSAALWSKYGEVRVTSPATALLPTYCAICFVMCSTLRENNV